MRPLRPLSGVGRLGRPFLDLPKSALTAAATDVGLPDGIAPDPSNADLRFARNALRAVDLPRLLARHGRARLDRLARAAAARQRRFDRLDAEADSWIRQHTTPHPGGLVARLDDWPDRPALARTVLQQLHRSLLAQWPLRTWTLRALALAAGRAGRHLDAHPALRVTRTRTALHFVIPTAEPRDVPTENPLAIVGMGGSPAATLPYCPPPRSAAPAPRGRTTEWPSPPAAQPEDP
jgi:hypothetical protein